jgi:hypothetical protein
MKNDFVPTVAWIVLTAICIAFILIGLNEALRKSGREKKQRQKITFAAGSVIATWIALLLILSYNGFFADFSHLPPRPGVALLVPLPFILLFAFSKKGTELLQSIPAHWLIYMQSFRIAVELLLLLAFIGGKLPVQMTLEGRNFDIITGILALPVGYWVATKRSSAKRLAIAFNVIGLVLLLNILVLAVLSMPTPIRYFMNEPANTIVAQFPYILLPGVLVPVAYGLHILSIRQLIKRSVSGKLDRRNTPRPGPQDVHAKEMLELR